ncbi:MAG: sugar ABC transporter ATP-binding protein [Actinobacteria bacterium]|nr:sugar ABC transporter ATP-binding protein [Actinomycetota bacterium]
MENKIVLEVKNLCKYFGGIKAIDNINLKLYEKEIIAIVGDNGAGKSTLIKTISGVYKRTSGEIYINNKLSAINDPKSAKVYGIETVYQDQGVISILNAPSNLFLGREKTIKNFWGKIFKFTDDRFMKNETKNLLKKLDVELKNINSEISTLSGGQRQTVIIGRAVYWGGKILIFDEPTNNLGVKQERRILDLIKKLREEFGVSIIVITHNIEHVFELVDRIIVLRNGMVVGEKQKKESNHNEIVSMITGV